MIILNRIVREPAALLGLVTLLLAGGSIFGWWQPDQQQFEWLLALSRRPAPRAAPVRHPGERPRPSPSIGHRRQREQRPAHGHRGSAGLGDSR